MAKILVVDDNAINRKLLVALLSHDGHFTVEASDGAEALEVARMEGPQLVISDIVMPTMDGFDFVRALRADADLRGTPVIFYTALYHEREAQRLALACDVARVLIKPCPPVDLLKAVEQVMAGVSESGQFLMPETFDREHLLLLTNKLAEQSNALAAANSRLVALAGLHVELSSLRDPHELLQRACNGARGLMGSRYAVLALAEGMPDGGAFHAISGIDVATGRPAAPSMDTGPLGAVVRQGHAWRVQGADATVPGFPPGYPAASAFLAVPLAIPARSVGWLCLADKLGSDGFTPDDERVLVGLGVLVAQLFDAIVARADLRREAEALRREQDGCQRLAQSAQARVDRVYAVVGGVGLIAAQARHRDELCRGVCQVMAAQGDFRLAYVELLDPPTGALLRVAAAGNLADADAFQRIALPTHRHPQPLICNDLRADPGVPYRQDMLDRGYRAVAALPLLCSYTAVGRLVLITEREGRFDAAEMQLLNEVSNRTCLALTRIAGEDAATAA